MTLKVGCKLMKGLFCHLVNVQRICRRFSKFAYVDVCVWGGGKCLLTSCERIIQKKTLNPFVFTQSGWMLYYNK